jgi:hypothetical protein
VLRRERVATEEEEKQGGDEEKDDETHDFVVPFWLGVVKGRGGDTAYRA